MPQALVLPRCDLVVSHGGSGSVIGALLHGRPMVLIPMGADQPLNAARVEALGVGSVLDPLAATPATIRIAVAAVLGEPACRAAAERLRAEIEALPAPPEAVRLIEELVMAGTAPRSSGPRRPRAGATRGSPMWAPVRTSHGTDTRRVTSALNGPGQDGRCWALTLDREGGDR